MAAGDLGQHHPCGNAVCMGRFGLSSGRKIDIFPFKAEFNNLLNQHPVLKAILFTSECLSYQTMTPFLHKPSIFTAAALLCARGRTVNNKPTQPR